MLEREVHHERGKAMQLTPKPLCQECEAPKANIVTLFTREPFCGRRCLSEGQCRYIRTILRMRAEEIENGMAV